MAIAELTPSSVVKGLDENRFQQFYEFLQAHGYCEYQIHSRPQHPPPICIQFFRLNSLIKSSYTDFCNLFISSSSTYCALYGISDLTFFTLLLISFVISYHIS